MDNKGLTFIEVLIGILIILTISSILLPRLSLVKKIYEEYEIYKFLGDIKYARNKAISENRMYYLHIVNKKEYIIRNVDDSNSFREEFKSNIEFLSPNGISKTGFKGNGTVENSKTIKLKTSKARISVSITPVVCNINKREIGYE